MSEHFDTVKEYVLELGFHIDEEVPEDEIIIINDADRGIHNLLIDCEVSLVVVEQLILQLPADPGAGAYRQILQMNRGLVFGAFVLDESGTRLLYRNTLALDNLDLNELETTINALSLGLAENGEALLALAG